MKRIQRKRTKGWKMSKNTIFVGRPTKWGNPFKLDNHGYILYFDSKIKKWEYWSVTSGYKINDILELYQSWIENNIPFRKSRLTSPPDIKELKGKNLACFCSLDQPCHADILLKLANK